ncbi:hypothetical protein [Priestia megaterium]|uniref:Uncharacterized protein n=1 Tax=Priestia megaterium TaxID=1404 RepID=A0A6M6DZS4_PRIMG|nr:hypothetical protein [Priestia megaterium]QJX80100.1 hypothetical protein FDZ14_28810 [Priestia megaterium]
MKNLANTIKNVQQTPYIGWKILNYKAPVVLSEAYTAISDILTNLAVKAVEKRDLDNSIQPDFFKHTTDDDFFSELKKSPNMIADKHFTGGGGFVSDYVISKVHSTPFKPTDLDFFIDGRVLEDILYVLTRNTPVPKQEVEVKPDVNPEVAHNTHIVISDDDLPFDTEDLTSNDLPFPDAASDADEELPFDETLPFDIDSDDLPFGFEPENYVNQWDYFGEQLKEIFVDCEWEDLTESGKYYYHVNVIYRFSYKGLPVELIIGQDDRVLNFDVSFRCVYYKNDSIYINELGLEDIKNKVIRVLHPDTPISTILRIYDFKKRYGYTIDNLSLLFLFASFNDRNILEETFISTLREHKKYSIELEKEIFSNPHNNYKRREIVESEEYEYTTYITDENNCKQPKVEKRYKYTSFHKPVIEFDYDHFSEYNPSLSNFYVNAGYLLGQKGSILYNKVAAFFKNKDIVTEVVYNRPSDWFTNEIFTKAFEPTKNLNHWLLKKRKEIRKEYKSWGRSDLTFESLKIFEAVFKDNLDFSSSLIKYPYSMIPHLPVIARSKEFKIKFTTSSFHQLVHQNILYLYLDDTHTTNELQILVDFDEEIFKFGRFRSSMEYFGMFGEVYKGFVNHIQKSFGFTGLDLETNWNYAQYCEDNIDELSYSRTVNVAKLVEQTS